MRDELRRFLRDAGAPDADIERAEQEGWLPLLALDRVVMPGHARYDLRSLATESGLDEAWLRRLWRALGFPDVPPDVALFTDTDVETARRLVGRSDADQLDRETLIRQVQVVSASMARIASIEADAIADVLQRMEAAGVAPDKVASVVADAMRWEDLSALIDYEHRVQLRAAIWRRLALDAAPDLAVGVGFADLAGYTKATAHLEASEISDLIARWEDVAYDTVSEHGGRVVKTIGDEVMFVGLPEQIAATALALRDIAAADPMLLPVRAGIAAGPVVARNGDFYGPVVNLASRLTEIAPSGTVLAPASLEAELDAHGGSWRWRPYGLHHLRGIGAVATVALDALG